MPNCIKSTNFNIDYRGSSISIKSININITGKDSNFMTALYSKLIDSSLITFNVLIYKINGTNNVDMTNQVYAITNNNNLMIDYNSSDFPDTSHIPSSLDMILRGTIADNIIYFPQNGTGNLKPYNTFTSNDTFFMGLSINFNNVIIMNSVEYSQNLNGVDLSSSTNTFVFK